MVHFSSDTIPPHDLDTVRGNISIQYSQREPIRDPDQPGVVYLDVVRLSDLRYAKTEIDRKTACCGREDSMDCVVWEGLVSPPRPHAHALFQLCVPFDGDGVGRGERTVPQEDRAILLRLNLNRTGIADERGLRELVRAADLPYVGPAVLALPNGGGGDRVQHSPVHILISRIGVPDLGRQRRADLRAEEHEDGDGEEEENKNRDGDFAFHTVIPCS